MNTCIDICTCSNNPESIEVMLEFMGRLSVREMQSLVATVLFEATPRYRYNDVVGHLIGDLLVYYADLLITDPPFGKCKQFTQSAREDYN